MYCDLWISKFKKEKFPRLLYEKIRYVLMKHTNLCNSSQTSIYGKIILFLGTVFPHIVAAATILFWIHLVRKLFKFSFPLCNENLNSFLTRWGNYSRRGNYSREETIWGNTVPCFHKSAKDSVINEPYKRQKREYLILKLPWSKVSWNKRTQF